MARVYAWSAVIFELTEDEVNGGYSAGPLGLGVHNRGWSPEDIPGNGEVATDCHLDGTGRKREGQESLTGESSGSRWRTP